MDEIDKKEENKKKMVAKINSEIAILNEQIEKTNQSITSVKTRLIELAAEQGMPPYSQEELVAFPSLASLFQLNIKRKGQIEKWQENLKSVIGEN